MKLLCLLLGLIITNSAHAGGPTLHFQERFKIVPIAECDESPAGFSMLIINSSDSEQPIVGSFNNVEYLPISSTDAQRRNGYYQVPANDTVWVRFYLLQPAYHPQQDTLVISSIGGKDTLFLETQSFRDSIEVEANFDFDMIPTSPPVFRQVTFKNLGEMPYAYNRTNFGGLIFPDGFLDDTLYPGETRAFVAQVDNRVIGERSVFIPVKGCTPKLISKVYRVYDPRAYFTQYGVSDTLSGCGALGRNRDRSFTIKNDTDSNTTITSIQLSSPAWIFADSTWFNATIRNGDSLTITLRRVNPVEFVSIELRTSTGAIDRTYIRTFPDWTGPRFYIEIDTLRLKGGALVDGYHQFTLFAEGNLPSFVTSVSISDSVHWEISGVEIGDTLQFKTLLHGELRFKGASAWGDYPVALRITSTPCDTVLTRTVIMHWTGSGVDEEVATPQLVVYPLPASSLLNVETPIGSEIIILDLLGHELIKTKADLSSSVLDVGQLAEGSYILMTKHEGRVESRKVVIQR
jgi:hypothetical protein